MLTTYADNQDLGSALVIARDKLEEFERDTINRGVLTRLRSNSPFHPFLLVRALALMSAALLGVAAVSVMAAPLISRDLAQQIGQIDSASPLPLPAALGLLAACGLLFALGAHLAALVAGRSAPLLPHEARIHQRLVSDVKRLEAQHAVSQRLTPGPPSPRAHAT